MPHYDLTEDRNSTIFDILLHMKICYKILSTSIIQKGQDKMLRDNYGLLALHHLMKIPVNHNFTLLIVE